MSRRVLLAAGGITLLAGCSASAERIAATAQTRPAPGGKPGNSSGGSLAGRSSVPRRPSDPDPTTTQQPGPGQPGAGQPGHGQPGHGGARHGSDRLKYYVDDGPKAIALTIDDGPSSVYTPQVLKLLAKYRVTATFSMIGIQVARMPGIAREVAAAGHQISNHTWRHLDLQWLSQSGVFDEIDRATGAIHDAIGSQPAYFRAPFGAWSPVALHRCMQLGMTPLDWSVDPRDWSRPGVPMIVDNIMRHTRTGSIILEHDGGGNRSQTVAALGIVIPRLLAAGYHFTTP